MDEADPVVAFEKACESAVQIQQELLQEILERNSGCEYLQRYGGPKDLGAFKAWVPVINYEDVAADIQRIVDGDTSPILCSDPVTGFAISSGTSSGKPKIIPLTKDVLHQLKDYQVFEAYKDKLFHFDTSKPVGLIFGYCMEQFKTKSGLLLGSITTSMYKTQVFKEQEGTTSPYNVIISGSNCWQTTYCHLLCGLLQRHKVQYIYAVFAFALSEALRMLRLEWEDICEDISTGCLNRKITDEKLRLPMSKVLKPSKEAAEEVRSICSRESWENIIPLLWPRAKYVMTIVTGAMQTYVPALKKHAGELPLVGLNYASSEGFFGINMQPDCPPEKVVFTILPSSVYFEFIPLDDQKETRNVIVDITGVEPGKLYELVVTTAQGLYRYKVGDVVKVTGFYHKAPQLAFSHRKSATLSITTEKVDEYELQSVILDTARSRLHGVEVANFTAHVDFITEQPPHYVIFWELVNREDYNRHEALKECCDSIDRAFNMKYLTGRVNRAIGALELAVVKQGTFEKLMEHAVRNGASPAQYKTPRCITAPGMLELLKNGTARSYRSEEEVPVSLVKEWKPSFPGSQL